MFNYSYINNYRCWFSITPLIKSTQGQPHQCNPTLTDNASRGSFGSKVLVQEYLSKVCYVLTFRGFHPNFRSVKLAVVPDNINQYPETLEYRSLKIMLT